MFFKRYLLNESENKDLIVISCDGSKISQYKSDTNRYEYNGAILKSENYSDTYVEFASLDALTFEGKELTLNGFAKKYENWLNTKRKAFDKKLVQLEEENRRRMEEINRQAQERNRLYLEQQERIRKAHQSSLTTNPFMLGSANQQHQRSSMPSQPDISYEQRRQEVLPLMEQQQAQVRDSLEMRWIKCEKCGTIDTYDKFVSYGGQEHINLGICYNCSGSKRPPVM